MTNNDQRMSREKQIEEMANIISSKINGANFDDVSDSVVALYDASYRKQSEGEWIQQMRPFDDFIVCSSCGEWFNIIDNCTEKFNFCPNCGARMGGD